MVVSRRILEHQMHQITNYNQKDSNGIKMGWNGFKFFEKMNSNRHKWIQIESNGIKWNQMESIGIKRIETDSNGLKWTQVESSLLFITFLHDNFEIPQMFWTKTFISAIISYLYCQLFIFLINFGYIRKNHNVQFYITLCWRFIKSIGQSIVVHNEFVLNQNFLRHHLFSPDFASCSL